MICLNACLNGCLNGVVQKPLNTAETLGEPCWVRTSDLLIKSQLLYRLS